MLGFRRGGPIDRARVALAPSSPRWYRILASALVILGAFALGYYTGQHRHYLLLTIVPIFVFVP